MFFTRNFRSNRRRHERELLNTSVRLFTGTGSMESLGINVSEVGMCLFTIANLPVGSDIDVEYVHVGENEPRRVRATVRHRALYLYGIEFCGDSDQDATREHQDSLQASHS